jgi:hypothetical protein
MSSIRTRRTAVPLLLFEGEQRYAVDMEGYGALQFVMECNLIPHKTPQ